MSDYFPVLPFNPPDSQFYANLDEFRHALNAQLDQFEQQVSGRMVGSFVSADPTTGLLQVVEFDVNHGDAGITVFSNSHELMFTSPPTATEALGIIVDRIVGLLISPMHGNRFNTQLGYYEGESDLFDIVVQYD